MAMAKKNDLETARSRNREGTERSLIEAAKQVLAEEGFQSFGVNAIARRAGCDKQLIYRYFGGLEGLADAVGADLAESLAAELTPLSAEAPPRTYAALMEQLLLGLLHLLRSNRLMQQINAWETAMPSPLVKRFVEARSRKLAAWMHAMRADLAPPEGVDAPALNAVLIAATQQLVLSASASGEFSGLSLQTDAHWRRAESALATLVRAVYLQLRH
jgi:AcrR family transcriptional regulator